MDVVVGLEAVELAAVGADDEVGVVAVEPADDRSHRSVRGQDDEHTGVGEGFQRRRRPQAELVGGVEQGAVEIEHGHPAGACSGPRPRRPRAGTPYRRSPALRCRRCGRSGSGPSSWPRPSLSVRSSCARSSTAAPTRGQSPTGPSGQASTVVCIPELQSACRALAADEDLDLTIEPAGTTYERLVADPGSAPEAWVTLAPWPQMVSSAVSLSGGEDPFPAEVALAPDFRGEWAATPGCPPSSTIAGHHHLAVRGRRRRATVGRARWEPAWGVLKPSHADAAQSAIGLLAFSAVVSDYWGSTDYTGTDLQNDDAFLSWLGRYEGAIPPMVTRSTPHSPSSWPSPGSTSSGPRPPRWPRRRERRPGT